MKKGINPAALGALMKGDIKNAVIASIFYKAAFYDRHAHISLNNQKP